MSVSTPQPIRETFHAASTEGGADTRKSFSEEVERLAEEFRARLARAAAEAERHVRADVAARMNEEFDEKFQAGVRMVREEMAQRLEAARAEWQAERQKLLEQIEGLKQLGDTGRLYDEVRETEAAIARAAEEVEAMVADPNVRLSDVMRKKTEHAELAAYLRGLRGRSGDAPARE